ncbi:MAG: YcxB family protein [Planctomycetaceae bacterium]
MIAFNTYFLNHSRFYWKFKIALFIIFSPTFPALLILLDQIILVDINIPLIANVLLGLSMAIVVIVAVHFLLPSRLANRIRSIYSDPHHNKLLGDIEFQIDETGLRKKSKDTESFGSWRAIQKIEKTDEYGFLFIAHNSAHIIPKRCLTPEEFEQFMAKAQEYWLAANPPTQLPTPIAGQR